VVQFSNGKVEAILAKGGPILLNTAYKVQAGRRVTSGTVEIHAYDTDIFYIVGGTATFVTGGTAVGQTNAGPGEDRAESITGGSERQLAKGDVIVIPKGIPHQFTKVDSPFTYFVVKVKE
jgi:mannose-6-phosphate isomerase-like protein (cupin superfamily)